MSSRIRPITFKTTLSEEKFLHDLAKKNKMNVSEYIRSCLFEDQNFMAEGKKIPLKKSEKDMAKLLVNCYNLIYKLAENQLEEKELCKIVKKSKDWLERNEYI